MRRPPPIQAMIPLLDSTLDPSTFRLIDAYVTSQMQAMHVPGVALGIVQATRSFTSRDSVWPTQLANR